MMSFDTGATQQSVIQVLYCTFVLCLVPLIDDVINTNAACDDKVPTQKLLCTDLYHTSCSIVHSSTERAEL